MYRKQVRRRRAVLGWIYGLSLLYLALGPVGLALYGVRRLVPQGVDGILMNTALADAARPVLMAQAMRDAVEAGRAAYLAGRMPRREVAVPSSPFDGMLG